jgi:hypothetical protein
MGAWGVSDARRIGRVQLPSHLVLLTSDEVRRAPFDRQILFKAAHQRFFARKLYYDVDPEFRRLLHDGAKGIALAGADAAHS